MHWFPLNTLKVTLPPFIVIIDHLQKLWAGGGCGIVLHGKSEPNADVQAVMRAVELGGGAGNKASMNASMKRALSLRG